MERKIVVSFRLDRTLVSCLVPFSCSDCIAFLTLVGPISCSREKSQLQRHSRSVEVDSSQSNSGSDCPVSGQGGSSQRKLGPEPSLSKIMDLFGSTKSCREVLIQSELEIKRPARSILPSRDLSCQLWLELIADLQKFPSF